MPRLWIHLPNFVVYHNHFLCGKVEDFVTETPAPKLQFHSCNFIYGQNMHVFFVPKPSPKFSVHVVQAKVGSYFPDRNKTTRFNFSFPDFDLAMLTNVLQFFSFWLVGRPDMGGFPFFLLPLVENYTNQPRLLLLIFVQGVSEWPCRPYGSCLLLFLYVGHPSNLMASLIWSWCCIWFGLMKPYQTTSCCCFEAYFQPSRKTQINETILKKAPFQAPLRTPL